MSEEFFVDVRSISKKTQIANQTVWYLEDIHLSVRRNQVCLIVGKAKSGKSIVFDILAGLTKPETGIVDLDGVTYSSLKARELERLRSGQIGMVFREPRLIDSLTLGENIELMLKMSYKLDPDQVHDQAAKLLKLVGMNQLDLYPVDISYALQKRVAVARALANSPKLLLVDELEIGLDQRACAQILQIIRTWVLQNDCAAVLTSSTSIAEPFADSIVYLENGVIQQKLDAASQKGGHISRSTDSGLFVLDSDLRFTIFNKQAEKILGFAEEEVVGKKLSQVLQYRSRDKKISLPEDMAESQLLGSGQTKSDQELFIKDKFGQWILVALHIEPRFGAQGTRTGTVSTFSDISEQIEMDRVKSDFAAIAAHELRTPLTGILGSLDLYVAKNEGKIPDEDAPLLENMRQSILRLRNLTENLIRISRIERDDLKVKTKQIIYHDFVSQIVAKHIEQAKAKDISLRFEQDIKNMPMVDCDPAAMTEAIDNLLLNAMEHTPAGGEIVVRVVYEPKMRKVFTSIQDSGSGISSEELRHLFTKFYRAKKEHSYTDMHLGLGLFITKVLVEYHQGEIRVESEVGRGTTFTFWLPLQDISA